MPEGALRHTTRLCGDWLVDKGKGTKVDTAELLAHIQPQLIKCYTPQGKGAAHPMRPLVMALVKKLTASAGSAAPSAAGA